MDEEDEKRKEQLEWLKYHPPTVSGKNKKGVKEKSNVRQTKNHRNTFPPNRGGILETRVEEEIDLHGMTVDEAMAKVSLLFEAWKDRSGGRIRIIHGRGNRSPDSILANLNRNLSTIWRRRVASHFQEAHNSGATIVILE